MRRTSLGDRATVVGAGSPVARADSARSLSSKNMSAAPDTGADTTSALPAPESTGSVASTSPISPEADDDLDPLPDEIGNCSNDGKWIRDANRPPDAPLVSLHMKEALSIAAAQNVVSSGSQTSLLDDHEHLDDNDEKSQVSIMAARAYQLEMLDHSLKHNVIVAMDTGSGKTQVAVLRIKAELEKFHSNKIIWFLAPTISLCSQQCEVIKLQIPAASIRLLTGNYDVHTWGASIWEAVLSGVRIVISTPQVLLDALDHAYITMEQLSLIVFDEVHNCIGKSPGGRVMSNHYHPRRLANESVPSILGLTATPSIRSDVHDLEVLETLMDARCISPTLHRDELLKCVKQPQISHAAYIPRSPYSTPTMQALNQVYLNLDIKKDPYILGLRSNPTDRNKRALRKAIEKYDTYSQNQMKGFCFRASETCLQLGPWAADLYIWKVISIFLERLDTSVDYFDKWPEEEKKYLANALRQVAAEEPPKSPKNHSDISDKISILLRELLNAEPNAVGIIFVKERAMVTMLFEVLRANPRISKRYQMGTMVGTSNHTGRKKSIYEFLGNADLKALQNFRSGKINLLIATAVLEEGIDVPACNLVICFDNPSTPKSFIQRRGRARMKDSRLVLLLEHSSTILRQWEVLEGEMKRLYEAEEREFRRLEMVEESEDSSNSAFIVPATGARLEFDNAKQHLEHFCRVLKQGDYVDSRPDYIIELHTDSSTSTLSATVLLPSFLPVELRQHKSASTWKSEKNATKDAAFQAYVSLYRAGLINDNLLPLKDEKITGIEAREAMVEVQPLMGPWHLVAPSWREQSEKWVYSMSGFDENHQLMGEYEIVLPVWINQPQPMKVFLDRGCNWELNITEGRSMPHIDIGKMSDHTSTLLALHFTHRWNVEEREHVIRVIAKDEALSMDDIGACPLDLNNQDVKQGRYLIRDASRTPFLYKDIISAKPAIELVQTAFFEYERAPDNMPYLNLTKWTRRADFLHRLNGDPSKELPSTKLYSRVLPLAWSTVDRIPMRHAQFGMLIPTLIHELGVMLIAKELSTTLLKPIEISDLDLVKEAISARSASEPVHYERLEFLGDSILKFCSSVAASAKYPEWPEGYLSSCRDQLIANSRLSRAALENELPKYIITKPFTGHKWRPLYLDDVLQDESQQPNRKLSTKTLADVVEALIGASYVDGGITKALKCISLFLKEFELQSLEAGRAVLYNKAPHDETLPPVLEPLEELIGYSFQRKALLMEAMTHASYVVDTGKRSLERLEFLGDAVLDNIIVTRIFRIEPPLPHHRMHTLKTAMVNGDFIAFMTLEHGLRWTESDVTETAEIKTKDTFQYLWKFMRHASLALGIEQRETEKRHALLRLEIIDAMQHGTTYPWALLAHLQPRKFYSDLFEALLGAVWVDSGSMAECEDVARRFGIIDYLDRILRDEVHVRHPKEDLGQWAVAETVTYITDSRDGDSMSGEREYLCKVMIGERVVAEVGGGVTKEEVKTRAATEALKLLERERSERMKMVDELMSDA